MITLLIAASLAAEAQHFFAEQSVNPPVAQFRHVRLVGDVACGEINKPNQQGGFDGFRRFVYESRGHWAIEGDGIDYRFAENGKPGDTKFMAMDVDLEIYRDVTLATKLQGEVNDTRARLDAFMARCGLGSGTS